MSENRISVFPVPASGYVTVETNSENLRIERITIYNEQGQQVSTTRKNINKSKLLLPVSKLPDGIYFMEIHTNEDISMKRIAVGN